MEAQATLPDDVIQGAWEEAERQVDAEQDMSETPLTEDYVRNWLWVHLGVHIPDVQVCPNHSTPWRAFWDAFHGDNLVSVWKASRGLGGKTYLLSALGDAEAVLLHADVTILGGSGEQSERVQEYISNWLKREPDGSVLKDNTREAELVKGGRLRALMASSKSVRGPHPQRLRVDEADEVAFSLVKSALGQPMTKRNIREQTVLSSTHQYADGTMTKLIQMAQSNAQWSYHEWCYRESMAGDGAWLTAQQVANKQATMTADTWQTEVEGQEPNPENRAIQTDKVEAMFDKGLGTYNGREGEYLEFEPPMPGSKYVHGADWARKVDWTVIVTLRIDVYPYRLVAFERTGRRPWPDMIAKFDARVKRYPGFAWHDGTGVGDVVAGYLTTPAVGVMMVGRARADMLTSYITGVERGMLKAPMIQWMHGEHKLASVRDVYGAGSDLTGAESSFHLPDSIAAMALAFIGAPKQYTGGASAWLSALAADADPTAHPAPLIPTNDQLTGAPVAVGGIDSRPFRLG